MVPQGQLASYTPTPANPAPPLYQVHLFQFPQPFHTPYMPAASPASSSDPSLYGHISHPASNVASAAPSSIYPSSSHHTNFTHNAGSEQMHTPPSFSNGGTLPCQWQGQDIPPSSSPPPPAYPPGFEPKQDDGSLRCISATAAMGNACVQPPHPNFHPHPHPHPPSHSHQHLHVNALPQLHQPPPSFAHPHPHPHPPSLSHHHPLSQTACHTPMLLPSVQTAQAMGHGYDTNGTVIGVPVMGTPIYGDGTHVAPPPGIPHGQQTCRTLQPKYGRRPMSSGTIHQPRKTTFHLTRYFQGNTLHGDDSSKGARNAEQITWQTLDSQTQQVGTDGQATSRFWDSNQRPVPSKVDNASPDCCLSAENNRQPQVPLRDLRFGTNGRRLPNTRWRNQAQPSEWFHLQTCCPAKEIALAKAEDVYVDAGQEKLSSCQSSKHIGNLQCEIIRDRPDEQPLRLHAVQQSSLALACSEAQLSSHVECEETACSPNASDELVKEHEMESASAREDSKAAQLPSVKKQEGLNRWLQERRHKYPTPANILRKKEERRKREEMGEFEVDKPKTRLQHIKGVFTKCYHRGERPRFDNKMKHQEQYIDNRQLANTGSRDGVGSSERNGLADSCQSANGTEVAEKEGPVESLPFRGEVTELEKGIQNTDSQSILTSDEIVEQIDHEKASGPGHVFLFRRKRQRRNCERSTSGVQRQKQLLFKILDCDIEKENSYLLQCCRFLVNNHFLQGSSPSNIKHFKWVGAGRPSSVDKSSMDGMHDLPTCARCTEMPSLGAQDFLTEKIVTHTQASANNGGQELTSLGKDDCQDSNEPSFATVENAIVDHVSVKDAQHASALPQQELSCSDQGQELIEDAHYAPLLPPQEMNSSGKEQEPIEVEQYNDPGSQNRFFNGSHRDKEVPFPWKYSDGYFHQKNILHGLATRPYDCFREPFCSNGLITNSKHAPLFYSSSNLDAQGPAPFLWERSTNAESQLPDHEMDTGEVGSGISDHSLNDDDDILQYMNFDGFETDSGICFV